MRQYISDAKSAGAVVQPFDDRMVLRPQAIWPSAWALLFGKRRVSTQSKHRLPLLTHRLSTLFFRDSRPDYYTGPDHIAHHHGILLTHRRAPTVKNHGGGRPQ